MFVIVPWKASERFPGKNLLLWPYTVEYLDAELAHTATMFSGTAVWIAARDDGDALPDECTVAGIPVRTCMVHGNSHMSDMQEWSESVGVGDRDTVVMLQVTNPVRRPGLLSDAAYAAARGSIVRSYTKCDNTAWLDLREPGPRPDMPVINVLDGAVFAAPGGDMSWVGERDPRPCTYIFNYRGPVCDIDTPDQFDETLVRALSQMAGRCAGGPDITLA